ncbi:hypothetical protein C8R42DRAFT_473524 [Lentinula raphanica]|nr:hypothetical protein C8R42DRAFT_473524 [Lentinula raphanica]
MAEVAQKAIDLGVPYSLEKLHSYIKLSTDIKHALANTDKSVARGPATESGDVEVGNSNSVARDPETEPGDVEVGNSNSVARDPETEPGDVEVGKGNSVTTRGSETESGDVELGKGNSIASGSETESGNVVVDKGKGKSHTDYETPPFNLNVAPSGGNGKRLEGNSKKVVAIPIRGDPRKGAAGPSHWDYDW